MQITKLKSKDFEVLGLFFIILLMFLLGVLVSRLEYKDYTKSEIDTITLNNGTIYINNLEIKSDDVITSNIKIHVPSDIDVVIDNFSMLIHNIRFEIRKLNMPKYSDESYIICIIDNNKRKRYKCNLTIPGNKKLGEFLKDIFKDCKMDDLLKELRSGYNKDIFLTDKTFDEILLKE